MKGITVPVHGLLNFKPETTIPVWAWQFDCQIQEQRLSGTGSFTMKERDGKQDPGRVHFQNPTIVQNAELAPMKPLCVGEEQFQTGILPGHLANQRFLLRDLRMNPEEIS